MKMKKNLIDYELLWEKITDYAKVTGRTCTLQIYTPHFYVI